MKSWLGFLAGVVVLFVAAQDEVEACVIVYGTESCDVAISENVCISDISQHEEPFAWGEPSRHRDSLRKLISEGEWRIGSGHCPRRQRAADVVGRNDGLRKFRVGIDRRVDKLQKIGGTAPVVHAFQHHGIAAEMGRSHEMGNARLFDHDVNKGPLQVRKGAFGGYRSVDSGFGGNLSLLVGSPNQEQREGANRDLGGRREEHPLRPEGHFLLSHKVGLFASFLALLCCFVSGLFVGNYFFNVVEYGPERRKVEDYWRLGLSAAVCIGLFGLFVWLTENTARI